MIAKKRKNRKSYKTIFFSSIFSLLILAIIYFLVISNWKINERRQEMSAKIESLKKEIQQREEKNSQLKLGTSQSQSQDYLEKVARENLDLKKPGEEVVVVKPVSSTTEQVSGEEKNLWQKIREKFGF